MNDAFELLGLRPTFRLEGGRLDEVHRQLSVALHPDRYLGRPASERRAALGKAIEVNQAYRTLKHPVERGQLLLRRLGHSTEARVQPEFLMEMMELREALRAAGAARDETQVEELARRVRAEQARTEERLVVLFDQALTGGTLDASVPELLAELRYYERFLLEANALLDDWL